MTTTTTKATFKRIFTFAPVSIIATAILTAIGTFLFALEYEILLESPSTNYGDLLASEVFDTWGWWMQEFTLSLAVIAVLVGIIAALFPSITEKKSSYSLFALIPMCVMSLIIAIKTADVLSYSFGEATLGIWSEIFCEFLIFSFFVTAALAGIVALIAHVYFRQKAKL